MKHIHKKPDDDRTGIIWRKPEAQHILTMAAFWDFFSKKYLRQISILGTNKQEIRKIRAP